LINCKTLFSFEEGALATTGGTGFGSVAGNVGSIVTLVGANVNNGGFGWTFVLSGT